MYNHNFQRENQVGFKERKVSESLAMKTEIFKTHSYIRNHPTHAEVEMQILKIMVDNDVTMFEEVEFISFLSFYTEWFGYNFVAR